MRRTHALAAAIAAAVLTGGVLGGTALAHHGEGKSSHSSAHSFTVIEHPDTDTVVDTGPAGDSPGDLLPFANTIWDATNTTQVGTDQGNCIRTKAGVSYECNWTTNLKNGSITVEGIYLDSGEPTTLAIIGGTGKYASARGSMVLASAGSNFSFTFTLRH